MFQYRVKVRGTTYLWGGAEMTKSLAGRSILAFKVDDFGEEITIGTRRPNEDELVTIGKLRPGQALTIVLEGLAGVWARTSDPMDSNVDCMIMRE